MPRSAAAKPPLPVARAVRDEDDDASEHLASAEAPDREGADGRIPGVPRHVSGAAKRTVATVVAVAAILVVAGGLRAMQVRQQREAEDARNRPVDTAASEPTSPASPGVTPTGSSAGMSWTVPAASAAAGLNPSSDPNVVATAGNGSTTDLDARAIDSLPLPTGPVRETSIAGPDRPGASVISQANHALARGETTRALTLAHQAVAANPADADAWLVLGAACTASGDSSGAREAYTRCMTQAHTANISECRLLARP